MSANAKMKHYAAGTETAGRMATGKGVLLLLALLLVLLMTGCGTSGKNGTISLATPDFFGFGDHLADQLVANRRPGTGGGSERLILTTFVNLDNLYESSGLGRAMAEGLSASLFRQGYRIAEIRKAQELFFKRDSGELALTRDAALVAREQDAQAIVVGTYSVTPRTVIVNVRMVAADSTEVLSVAGLEIERGVNVDYLLTASAASTAGDGGRSGVSGPMSAYER